MITLDNFELWHLYEMKNKIYLSSVTDYNLTSKV